MDGTTGGSVPRADRLPATGAWRPGDPAGRRRFLSVATQRPFALEGGGALRDITVAYETWGELADDAGNAVLVCHALTRRRPRRRAHRARPPDAGWWDDLVGPGRALDTDRYFVVCANVLGGCQGTTGPASTDPATGRPYGPAFPVVTIRDMVRAQAALADHLRRRPLAGRRRRVDGRHAGPGVGGDVPVPGEGDRRAGHRRRRPPRSRSPSRRRSATPSPSIPSWRGGDYYDAAGRRGPAPGPRPWPGSIAPGHLPQRERVRRALRPGPGSTSWTSAVAALRRRELPRLPRRRSWSAASTPTRTWR